MGLLRLRFPAEEGSPSYKSAVKFPTLLGRLVLASCHLLRLVWRCGYLPRTSSRMSKIYDLIWACRQWTKICSKNCSTWQSCFYVRSGCFWFIIQYCGRSWSCHSIFIRNICFTSLNLVSSAEVVYLFRHIVIVFKTCILFFNMNCKTNIPKDTAVSLDRFHFSSTR